MMKKMLYAAGVMLLMVVSCTQVAKYDAAFIARIKADAERGDASAQCALAECYDVANCEGITHDYAKACQWYEKAAAQGYAEAQYNLGNHYYNGKGVRQDYVKTRELWEKAAVQGDAEAQFNLGIMYANGKGVRQDYRTAKEWFGMACKNGYQKGCDKYRTLNKAGF